VLLLSVLPLSFLPLKKVLVAASSSMPTSLACLNLQPRRVQLLLAPLLLLRCCRLSNISWCPGCRLLLPAAVVDWQPQPLG
jgi:hypothetical protein